MGGKNSSAQESGSWSPAPHWRGLRGLSPLSGVKKPDSLHIPSRPHPSPAVEILEVLLPWRGDSGVDRGELFGPVRNGTVSVCPEWSLVRKWSGSIRSRSPPEGVWQVALRKNTKSGSSTWQLCVGRWQLRTGTDLPSTCLTTAVMRAASPRSGSGGFEEKGRFFCSVFPLSLGCSSWTVTTVFKEPAPPWLVWFGVRFIPSCECLLVWKVGLSHNTHS